MYPFKGYLDVMVKDARNRSSRPKLCTNAIGKRHESTLLCPTMGKITKQTELSRLHRAISPEAQFWIQNHWKGNEKPLLYLFTRAVMKRKLWRAKLACVLKGHKIERERERERKTFKISKSFSHPVILGWKRKLNVN